MASASGKMLSAEERRRQKELEEARKAGLAAPEVDEEGNAINPHIPQFMAAAPWYLNNEGPSLKHQKNWKGASSDTKVWYDRGAKVFQANKYRKGACENCGSMSHKTKDCMERPRSKGAKWTNSHIAADEKVEDIEVVGFEAKRDRWNGYSGQDWVKQAERFDKVAALRQEIRRKEVLEALEEEGQDGGGGADVVDGELAREEDKVQEEEEAGFAKVEKRVRAAGQSTGTVRNLRIREDTAKYLLNLDLESAHYDPKSRSMREDPTPDKDPSQKTFAGDTFVRQSGASEGFGQLNLFSVSAYERGQDVHLQATPSQAEVAFQTFKARKEQLQHQTKEDVLQRYGDAAEKPSEDVLALKATEQYVEYDAAGRVIRGQEVKARSRYEEDVHPGNHAAVWGSWWYEGQWGYACCHQAVRASYCTGSAGGEAALEAAEQLQRNMLAHAADKREDGGAQAAAEEGAEEGGADEKKAKRLEGVHPTVVGVWGTEAEKEDLQLDEGKLQEALQRQRAALAAAPEGDDRKRKYNSLTDNCDVSAEDMEAYRLVKGRGEDPLAAINQAKATQKGDGDGYDYV